MLKDTPDSPYTRARAPWAGPLVSTLLVLPGGFFAYVFAGLSATACDACTKLDSDHFDDSFGTGFLILEIGLGISFALLLASWFLPRQRRFTAQRGVLAVAAPFSVCVFLLIFYAVVDWP